MNKKELLVISIGVFFTIIAWMIADLYHAKKNLVVDDIVSNVTIPAYTIKPEIIDLLKQKEP